MTVRAQDISLPLEQLANRTATLVPDVQTFTSNDTWTKPANAIFVDFIVVGPGGDGGAGGSAVVTNAGGGGGGGGAGAFVQSRFRAADVPSSLTVVVTTGGSGLATYAYSTNFQLTAEAGSDGAAASGASAGAGGAGASPDRRNTALDGGDGGVGSGTVVNDARGKSSTLGNDLYGGGSGGDIGEYGVVSSPGSGGGGGYGYGAGGGGGGGDAGSAKYAGGGGAGAAGYGATALATAGTDGDAPSAGGSGAQGIVIITTWRGVAV